MRIAISELRTISWLRSQLEALESWRLEALRDGSSESLAGIERHYQWLRAEIDNLELSPSRAA